MTRTAWPDTRRRRAPCTPSRRAEDCRSDGPRSGSARRRRPPPTTSTTSDDIDDVGESEAPEAIDDTSGSAEAATESIDEAAEETADETDTEPADGDTEPAG